MREGTVSIPCLLGLSFLACIAAGRPLRADDLWANPILPFLKEHCTECHGAKKPKPVLAKRCWMKPSMGCLADLVGGRFTLAGGCNDHQISVAVPNSFRNSKVAIPKLNAAR